MAVKARIRSLEQRSVIGGYTATIKPQKISGSVSCYFEIETVPEAFADVTQKLKDCDSITQIYRVTGKNRLHVHGVSASGGEMEALVRDVIGPPPGVVSRGCNIILSRTKVIKGLRLCETADGAGWENIPVNAKRPIQILRLYFPVKYATIAPVVSIQCSKHQITCEARSYTMNLKELGELRRRLRPDRNAISRIYGCYVNSNREVISYLDESLGAMPQEESEKYLGLLKKGLSGGLGRNLIDIVFSTQQVMDSPEHRLLTALRDSELKNAEARGRFYQTVIDALDMEERNYLILLACDTYDVPRRGRDDEVQPEASDEVFRYILCCVCPVRDGRLELGFFSGDNEFHSCTANQIVAAPELGFLFPAFDDRAANLYNALFYTRKPDQIHHEFIDAVFHTEPPLSAAEQREAFQSALSDALGEEFRVEVIQAIHEQLRDRIEGHRERKDPEPLTVSPQEVGAILKDCGVEEVRVADFLARCAQQFGEGAVLNPENIIDSKRFEVKTADAAVTVDPEHSYLVEARAIDGRKYILIPADEGVEINGMSVEITEGPA